MVRRRPEDRGLVRHQHPGAEEGGVRRAVERDRRAVGPRQRLLREPGEHPAVRAELHQLVGAEQRDVHIAGAGDAEAVGEVERAGGPQGAQRAGAAVGPDRQPVEVATEQVERVGRRLLGDQERAAARLVDDAGGAELHPGQLLRPEPHARRAPGRGDPPDDVLPVVGDVERGVRPPGGVVRDRAAPARQIRDRRLHPEPAGADVEGQHPRPGLLQQHQPAARVGRRHLDAVGRLEILTGDRPRPLQRPARRPLEDARRHRVAGRVRVRRGVHPAVAGVHVDVRREAGRADPREDARLAVGLRGRGRQGLRRDDRQHRQHRQDGGPGACSHRFSSTSAAARSPERTAPSM